MKRLPKIPKSIYSVLSVIPVIEKETLPAEGSLGGSTDLGWWNGAKREILLRADTNPTQKYHTLLHEKVHMWFWDAGVQLPKEVEENICDVVASAILSEILHDR